MGLLNTLRAERLARQTGPNSHFSQNSHGARREPLAMPSLTREALATFAREGDSVGFRVPWLDKLLWWAPNDTEARRLVVWRIAERGQVWTATELETLIGLAGPEAKAVVLVKLAAAGEVVETRRRPAA